MVDTANLILFLPAMLAITLAPGPDTLFTIATALRNGAKGGVVGVCGIISGSFVHVGLATIGLSALIVKSAIAFSVLKYLGAAYLIYLGVRTLRDRSSGMEVVDDRSTPPQPLGHVFVQGFVTNVLNPKVALFFLAFLPQFVSVAHAPVWSQMLELSAIWYTTGFVYLASVALLVGRLRRLGRPSHSVREVFRYTTATIFIGLGIRVAVPESR